VERDSLVEVGLFFVLFCLYISPSLLKGGAFLLLKLEKIGKYVGERCLFRIDRLTLAKGESLGRLDRSKLGV
jgi:hypothetical protein